MKQETKTIEKEMINNKEELKEELTKLRQLLLQSSESADRIEEYMLKEGLVFEPMSLEHCSKTMMGCFRWIRDSMDSWTR